MPFIPAGKPRATALAIAMAFLGGASVWCGYEAGESVSRGNVRRWVQDAGELGDFSRVALERGNDLLVVERFARLARRDDFAYALVMDRGGRAVLHSDVTKIGTVYESEYAKRAGAAVDTLVQFIPAMGLVEIDAPMGPGRVLRMGFVSRTASAGIGWMWAGLGLALAGMAVSVLLALRAADKL